jgi:pyruvate,water dikinase
MGWIARPADPDSVEEGVCGGKGSSLARLVRRGVRVPPFFMVKADAHRRMGQGVPSPEFLDELRAALAELDSSVGLAVRSSAIGEDAAESSFAGLYHTSLEVKGFDAVVEAIGVCWNSYRAAAATRYRQERVDNQPGAMAVVVQEMVHGDWSGVCFTANPVNLCLSQGLINAVPGLGEALVSGDVNPEEITVDASDGRLLDRRAGDRPDRPLPEDAAAEVWRASKAIADQLAFPQDTEWAWRAGELFILQSRPITTIADVFYSRAIEPWKADPEADPDAPERIWSRMLADETWVSPISPLFYNIHNSTPGRVAFIRLHNDKTKLPPDIFKYHRATAYCDIDLITRMYGFQPKVARIRGVLNFLPAGSQDAFAKAPFRWTGRLYRQLSYEFSNRHVRSLFENYKRFDEQWPPYVEQSDRWFDMDLDALSLADLRRHLDEVRSAMAVVGPPCGVAVLSHATDLHLLLTGLLDRWCRHMGSDGENLYARISAGLDDSETVREGDALWNLGARIRALGSDMVRFARTAGWGAVQAKLAGLADGPALIADFEAFWRAHRHLGSTYKDLIWPRWGEDIDQCFSVVMDYADSAAVRPSEVNARSAQGRRDAQAEILAAQRGPLAPLRRSLLKFLFHYNELYMAVRDNHRYYVDRNWYALRRVYRSFGARLVTSGVLSDKDEVFFLGAPEVEDGVAGKLDGAEAARRIAVRRRVWETTLREQGPKFLKGWNAYADRPPAAAGASELQGIAASPGVAEGVARVIYDVRQLSTVKDGEILITRQTDPSWTTVFSRISGLVLETGGVLSHGTSLCREYGLPCVTAVEQATVKIKDGRRIELSGGDGLIRLL